MENQLLQALQAENQQLRRELLECRAMLQNIFVRNLIEDSVNPIHISNLDSQLEKNGIVLDSPWVLVCTMDLIGVGASDVENTRYPDSHEEFNYVCDTALRVCRGMLRVKHTCYSAVDGSEILLLVNLRPEEQTAPPPERFTQDVAETLRRALAYLQHDYEIFITATVSQSTEKLRDLTRIWRESRALSQPHVARPEDRVITPYDISESQSTDHYRAYNEKLFYNAVLTGDYKQARALTEAFLDTYPQEENTLWELKAALKKRLHTAITLCPPGTGDSQVPVTPEIDTMLARCKTLEQLETVLEHFFRTIAPDAPVCGSRTEPIRRYIQENYDNCELGIDLLCQCFGYSPSYLSHLYKQEQGENVVDTITRIRVQQAKQLLSSTDSNLSVIAERVGYNSAWTLTRAFRRCDGISPTQYRQNIAGA